MKPQYLVVIALAALAGATSAPAHEIDPGGKIKVNCPSDNVRMADINRGVQSSRYRATHSARHQMLSLAQQACARGATVVKFVPPADEGMCQTGAASCRDQTAAATPGASAKILP